MTYLAIRFLSFLGMATAVKLPKIRQESPAPTHMPVKVTLVSKAHGGDEPELAAISR
jgi:hypothetical protein